MTRASTGQTRVFHVYGIPFLILFATYTTVQALALGHRDGFPDFATFYESAQAWRQGADPYALSRVPNSQPPGALVLFAPLTMLAYPVAAWVFTLGSLVAGGLSLGLIARALALPPTTLVLVTLSIQPTALAIRQGQVSGLLMLLGTLAWLADRRGRSTLAAVCVGVLAWDKPFYGLLGLLWLTRGQLIHMVLAGGVTLGLHALAVLTLGPALMRAWLRTLGLVTWQAEIVNGSIPGLAARLFLDRPFPFLVETPPITHAPILATLVTAIGIGAVVLVSAWHARTTDRDRAWAVLGTAALLASPLGWVYYIPVGLGPIAATLSTRGARYGLCSVAAVPFAVLAAGAPYGVLGTITIGNWAFGVTLGLWAALLRVSHTK